MTDTLQSLDGLVQRAGTLYTLPAVAVEVLELTCRAEVDTLQLKATIERDPALVSKILRVVNSSLFGLSQPVRDLGQAITLLGIKPLKLLVLGFSLPDNLFTNVAGELLSDYWRRALIKAVAARELGQSVWRAHGDEAFLVGLLQDLGLLVLIQEIGQPYIEFLATVRQRGGNLLQLERELVGFDHTQLSRQLLAHWKLPEVLLRGIELPTSIETVLAWPAAEAALPQIVYLAELMVRVLVDQRPGALDELLDAGARFRQDLHCGQLERVAATIQEKVGQLAGVFSLEMPTGVDYRDVLARAHTQLVSAATDAAGDLLRARQAADREQTAGLKLLDEMQSLSAAVARITHKAPPRPLAAPEASFAPAVERPALATVTRSRLPRAANLSGETAVIGQLTAAAAACRAARCPLSLLLVEIDQYAALAFAYGIEQCQAWQSMLEEVCQGLDVSQCVVLAARDARLAVVLPGVERRGATEIAGAIARTVRNFAQLDAGKPAVTVSIGAAAVSIISKNFRPADLWEKADRCLYGAQAAGGDSAKSIEIY
ncbi:MAG: HDOD domain-containing protein [Pirellulales bacterium]|nr:HDOD domain-containing protein [Pirellulales bacterium]